MPALMKLSRLPEHLWTEEANFMAKSESDLSLSSGLRQVI